MVYSFDDLSADYIWKRKRRGFLFWRIRLTYFERQLDKEATIVCFKMIIICDIMIINFISILF